MAGNEAEEEAEKRSKWKAGGKAWKWTERKERKRKGKSAGRQEKGEERAKKGIGHGGRGGRAGDKEVGNKKARKTTATRQGKGRKDVSSEGREQGREEGRRKAGGTHMMVILCSTMSCQHRRRAYAYHHPFKDRDWTRQDSFQPARAGQDFPRGPTSKVGF